MNPPLTLRVFIAGKRHLSTTSFDLVILGAGLVGLSTARALKALRPDLKLCILDKESRHCQHQSSHNSGVIHSGIYYKPGSHKARLCAEGSQLLFEYCAQKKIPHRVTGKVIVAVAESEIKILDGLFQRGVANGLQGLRELNAAQLREVEPHCHGLKAVFIPSTAIVDFMNVANAYKADLDQGGAHFHFNFEVARLQEKNGTIQIFSRQEQMIETRHLISCAGLHSDRVSQLSGGDAQPKIVPFRGDYLMLAPEKHHLVKGNIYPVPDPNFPFLGVHFTPRMNGELWLGPNAVLAFAREGYRFRDFNWRDLKESLTYPGFHKLARKHFSAGFGEMYRDLVKSAFVKSLQRYIPEVQPGDCIPGPSGVRAQALGLDGSMVDDFVLDDRHPHMIHVRNAPSPAATSSMAIGRWIAQKAAEKFSLPVAQYT